MKAYLIWSSDGYENSMVEIHALKDGADLRAVELKKESDAARAKLYADCGEIDYDGPEEQFIVEEREVIQ